MKNNLQIHHRKSIRLRGYDYSREGLYFITICCHNRVNLFGKIIKNDDLLNPKRQMILNNAGKIANECWMQIPEHFPNVILHEHIIMPNHIHGIIELMGPLDNNVMGFQNAGVQNAGVQNAGVQNFEPQPASTTPQRNEYQKIIPRSIGSIIRGYKIGVTKWMRKNSTTKTVWQRNFYEIIIRNEQAYQNICKYITSNPEKWKEDKFYL